MRTCGYCGACFDPERNAAKSCAHHQAFYFPYDVDNDGKHSKGWQCCGSEDRAAPGCTRTRHRSDVRKRYRKLSIAWDWVDVDEATERRDRLASQDRSTKLENVRGAYAARLAELDALVGEPLATAHAKFGPGLHTAHIESGTGGAPCWAESVYFEVEGLCFRLDTHPRRSSVHCAPEDPEVEAYQVFADRGHLDEVREGQITDFRGD